MPETDLQAVTSGVEAALGSTAETAHSFWEKYLGANALSKIIAAAILLIVCVVFIKLLMRLTGRLLEKSKIHTTMHSFIRTLVKLVLVFIAIMLIIFLLSGFWHGANWTFIAWGAYHAFLFLPLILLGKNRRYRDTVATITLPDGTAKAKLFPSFREAAQMLLTFTLAVFGWIIFRATGTNTLVGWVSGIFTPSLFTVPWLINRTFYIPLAVSILIMGITEWLQRTKPHGLEISNVHSITIRLAIYYVLIFLIVINSGQEQSFIYFQF